ncbi:MAG: peptide-methionine (R)-S-oxide reductase MsrB, partial [Polynucleobacter sp.]
MSKSDEQYRQELSEIEYRVTRQAATEPPFSGRYWDYWENGLYRCVCCGTALFVSSTKFDAGCGWPSYHSPANPQVIRERRDLTHGMIRTEVRCSNCDAHLG